jgi:hypothetical protein
LQIATFLGMVSPTRLSRRLRRVRNIGVIRSVTGTYRCHRTNAGRAAAATVGRRTEAAIIPAMI